MTHVPFLIAGWGIALVTVALYSISVMRRARRLSKLVPVERQRWMTGNDSDFIGES